MNIIIWGVSTHQYHLNHFDISTIVKIPIATICTNIMTHAQRPIRFWCFSALIKERILWLSAKCHWQLPFGRHQCFGRCGRGVNPAGSLVDWVNCKYRLTRKWIEQSSWPPRSDSQVRALPRPPTILRLPGCFPRACDQQLLPKMKLFQLLRIVFVVLRSCAVEDGVVSLPLGYH